LAVSTRAADPAVPGGIVTSTPVFDHDTTVAAFPLTVTVPVADPKSIPLIVTFVPPAAEPLSGVRLVITGAL
jgi:hypothetical protein